MQFVTFKFLPHPALRFWLTCLGLLIAGPANAYIGPGAGAGTIAVVLGILASIFFAFVAIVWFPFKRMMKRRRANQTDSNANDNSDKEDGNTKADKPGAN